MEAAREEVLILSSELEDRQRALDAASAESNDLRAQNERLSQQITVLQNAKSKLASDHTAAQVSPQLSPADANLRRCSTAQVRK